MAKYRFIIEVEVKDNTTKEELKNLAEDMMDMRGADIVKNRNVKLIDIQAES